MPPLKNPHDSGCTKSLKTCLFIVCLQALASLVSLTRAHNIWLLKAKSYTQSMDKTRRVDFADHRYDA